MVTFPRRATDGRRDLFIAHASEVEGLTDLNGCP